MIIHNVDECQQWVIYKAISTPVKQLIFEPRINDVIKTREYLVDINGRSFQHNEVRIIEDIEQLYCNYPKTDAILKDLDIFMCPKPSITTANGCANREMIVYYARSTQIPWCMTDYITVHELGHVLQTRTCDRYNKEDLFREYLELRNAPKALCEFYTGEEDKEGNSIYEHREDFVYMKGEYSERTRLHGEWDTSPLEWFAEDFRYLFGVDRGDKFWGLPIDPPDDKVKDFILSL